MVSLDQAVPKPADRVVSDGTRFEQQAHQTRKRISNVVYRMLGDISEAEDIIQETYVRAWSHYARFDQSRPFEAWVTRIAVHLCIDFYRRRKKKGILSLDTLIVRGETTLRLAEKLTDTTYDPARCLLEQEVEEKLTDSLRGLPKVYLSCLLLVSQGCSYTEIGDIMGCPVGSVRFRIHRARVMAKRALNA